ncbi:MAG: patatin-like phospholipase family protein [Mesorhizobium sp.]|uniref:patatin-like phospholipase family protein n=1 Tax=Mesorhizobium sp. TaxID=1871066 RepID=UPI001ACA7D35|nr:patatin-like phospholipase family protein [Mesorhizobium sp.]MBN9217661.1 patatin-like phospholipase family protein [Mesorhizobium sp.]
MPEAASSAASAEADDGTVAFDRVRADEYRAIHARRDDRIAATAVPENLFGVALSGGGIRSASFSLGALQALHLYDLIPKIDYLSTVSGGGYIGTSMVAALTRSAESHPRTKPAKLEFPFADTKSGSDSSEVKHLRDNSKFLAPNGLSDIGLSLAILLRGLMVNFLLLLTVMLPLATLLILANPTTAHLDRSLISDLPPFLACPNPAGPWCYPLDHNDSWLWLYDYIKNPWIMSKVCGALVGLWLIGWALSRSIVDFAGGDRARDISEPSSRGARTGRWLLILFCSSVIIELQPYVIKFAIWLQTSPDVGFTLKALAASAAALITSTAAFRGVLVGWIERALNTEKTGAWLQGLLAKAAFYAVGLALPLLLYGLFIMLVAWGIKIEPPLGSQPSLLAGLLTHLMQTFPVLAKFMASWGISVEQPSRIIAAYALGPHWLTDTNYFWRFVLCTAVLIGASWIITYKSHKTDDDMDWRERRAFLVDRLRSPPIKSSIAFYIVAALVLAVLAAMAVRPAGTDDQWWVLCNYLGLTLSVWLITLFFTENANGLHRLYRDRLQSAFELNNTDEKAMKLHEISKKAPYLLVNGTLNVKRSAQGNITTEFDPAKRGRNAEFFVFSKNYVGSDATGYAEAERFGNCEDQLDLATAAAISGAAVSSSMGRIRIGLLGPTLAILNLRLGFWLANPQKLLYWERYRRDIDSYRSSAKDEPAPKETKQRRWEEYLRLYLFQEAFGILRSDSSRIYITDGGHLDNLGLYQLLKRKCKLIVVVDGEADPGMNFGAFCDVQRFIRIDENTRIELDWQPIRDTVIQRQADRSKREPAGSLAHLHHFAIGRIAYVGQKEEGLLLYIKAAVTGDEPDYVLDYERRNPVFPHESTSHQFFSEEQMEAYRALGFHSVKRALDGLDIKDKSQAYKAQKDLIRKFRRDLKVTKYIDPRPKPARNKRSAAGRRRANTPAPIQHYE